MAQVWTAEFYEDKGGKRPAEQWMDDLGAIEFAAMNAAILHVLEPNGLGLVRTEWLKALGQGLHEFRVRHTVREIVSMFAEEGVPLPHEVPGRILLRLFVHFHGNRVILLLSGYDKGADPSPKRPAALASSSPPLEPAATPSGASVRGQSRVVGD